MADVGASSSRQSRMGHIASSIRENAESVIMEDFGKAKVVAYDAAKSYAWLYPFKGIFYFATHRALWKPFVSKLPQYVALYGSVLGGMFTLTYLPQLAIMVFVNGPFAVFTTIFLILNESAAIVNMISRSYLLRDAILETFDGTLLARNNGELVRGGREVKAGGDPIQRLGKALKSPFAKLSPKAIVRYFIYLPLNFIPVVGTAIFLFIQARGRGQSVHDRFFQLKEWSSSQKSRWLHKHIGPYTAFGLVATLLEMIPIASMFFTYTNTVGAALWAADIEAKKTTLTDEDSSAGLDTSKTK